MEKLLLVDGNSILNRAYYGIRPLTAPDGTPTNAVYGFLNILFKYMEEEKPTSVCVAFDVKAKTFRHKMYEQYKAQRKPAPEDFLVQLPVIKEVLKAMNCACIEKEGYEADDLIGTVSLLCEKQGVECRILTGDKDDLQLASNKTVIKLVISRMGQTTTTDYNADGVIEKYGVTPEEFIDVKGLMGDTSDNIPGVKGVGEKTAFSLIQKYHSIEEIYEKIDEIDVTDSVRKKLEADKESAFLSKTLATIDREVPNEYILSDFAVKEPNAKELAELFTRLNFKSFLAKLDLSGQEITSVENIESKTEIINEADIDKMLADKSMFCYVMDRKAFGNDLYFTTDGESVYKVQNITPVTAKRIFEDSAIKKCSYDIKEEILSLAEDNINLCGIGFDVMLAAYLAEPTRSSYDLPTLCRTYLGLELAERDAKVEDDGQIAMNFEAPQEDNSTLYADTVVAIYKLWKFFAEKIENDNQHNLYYDVELPLTEVLADMQKTGVYVDKNTLKEFGDMLAKRIEELTSLIYEQAGEEFNINSPKQLGEILFSKLGLEGGKKNKNGYSTSVDVLNKLIDKHPIIENVLNYRHLAKLQSTYVEGLLPTIEKDGRIHSSFNQTVTATGRISSTEPNLQNIPVRTELGREIRRMFVAEGEKILVDADYSQIELRVLAHISGDENMQNAFNTGVDIHTQTASQVFGAPIDEVTSQMRSAAKAVNFGIVYGIGAFSLAQDLKISRKEADEYIKGYLANYSGVDRYLKNTVEDASDKGYVTTIFGRRRNMPELRASNRITRAFGERVAMNAPIQGTAADIIKIAMVSVYKRLKEEGLKSRLILQVHDELIVEAYPDEKDRVEIILKEEMEGACHLDVPLVVDMNSGKSWFDTK